MVREIRLTKKADRQFDVILEYLDKEFGKSTATKFIERTFSFFDLISEHPQIGRIEDKRNGIYGFVLNKPVTVFFRFTNKDVVILNFFDNRMNPKRKYQ
jgi:plasmid stabilization system protein ParE